jgi:hypothetical protein
MVSRIPYESHLKSAAERRQVSPIFGMLAEGRRAHTQTEINVQ